MSSIFFVLSMNLEKKNIALTFLITLLLLLIGPRLFPNLPLAYVIPFLVIILYKKNFMISLWISCFVGLALDLISSANLFGLYACSYTLTTALLYKQRYHFFADSLSTLPLMTFFYSVLSTLILNIIMFGFEQNILSVSLLITDFLFLPFLDATYAFIVYVLPGYLLGKPIRRGSDYFASK